MQSYSVPTAIIEDAEALLAWAKEAVAIAGANSNPRLSYVTVRSALKERVFNALCHDTLCRHLLWQELERA